MKVNQKGFNSVIILLIILIILGIGTGAYYFGKSSDQKVPLTPPPPLSLNITPTITSTVSPTTALTSTPTPTVNPNSNVFISQDLGITFNYTTKSTGINDSKIGAKQIGNKVYVYSTSGKPEEGQYLEMFAKDKNESLLDAIKKKILTGYPLNDCPVETITGTFTDQSHPANFVLADINIPSENAGKCPSPYAAIGGIAYFLTDPNHPDKFIFLSIGQYGIDSGIGDKLWQNTIKFLP